MLKKKLTRVLCLALVLCALFSTLPLFSTEAAAAQNAYQSAVSSIDSKNPKTQTQQERWNTGFTEKKSGICNVCAMVTLLNRRLAYDGKSGSFTVKDVLTGNGCKNIKNSGKKWSYTGGTDTSWYKATYTNGNATYTAVRIAASTIKKATSKANFNLYLALLLHDHPEGLAVRNSKANHCAVIYKYELTNGKIQLYVNDPVNNYTGKIEGSYLYKKCNGDLYTSIETISYLKSSKPLSPLPFTGKTLTVGQTASLVPLVGSSCVSYKSSDASVCSISGSTLTARKAGSCSVTTTINGRTYTSSVTVKAASTAKSYTVSFNANGGSVSTSKKTVTYGSTYGTLPTPTRSGYTFDGWYTAKSGGSKIAASTKVTLTGNQTLYAHWTKAKTYTVSFNANGGSVSTSKKTVTYGNTYGTLPTPTRSGYTFDGWYTTSSGGSKITANTKVSITSNQTLYAHWSAVKAKSYTVSFNANGGSVSTTSKSVTNGNTYGTLPTPTRSGYAFNGWYTAASGGSKITASTTVSLSANQTLYAHWTASSPSKPASVTGLKAVYSNANAAKVSWNAVSGATSYEVQYYSRGEGKWLKDGSYSSGTSYVSTGLNKYDTWRFRVRAVNAAGSSNWVEITYTKP